ncbi:MAG: hypothetical protein L0387_42460 [Acidobacteria bacterium]|nr:hypothetical protein [Acidobacteriota bacterium]MCI0722301.1 hypothetical protein [Acidobacteriota bacterium]
MDKSQNEEHWIKSAEVKQALKLDACDLMHIRLDRKLRFKKQGNAFLYAAEDVERLRNKEQRPLAQNDSSPSDP